MDDHLSLLNDRNNSIVEFASIRGNLTEKEIDQNLCINGANSNNNKTIDTTTRNNNIIDEQQQYKSNKDLHTDSLLNFELTKSKSIIVITNTSGDNFLSSTAIKDDYLSEDDEFDLERIKAESLRPLLKNSNCHMSSEDFFKKEDSLDLDYDCSDIDINSRPYEIPEETDDNDVGGNNSPYQSNDIFMQEEEVFIENLDEFEDNQHNNIIFNTAETETITELTNLKNNEEKFTDSKYSSVLSDHNYISQEIHNSIQSDFIIKNSNDLQYCTEILKKYLTMQCNKNQQNALPELTDNEKIILNDLAEHLDTIKQSLNISDINNISKYDEFQEFPTNYNFSHIDRVYDPERPCNSTTDPYLGSKRTDAATKTTVAISHADRFHEPETVRKPIHVGARTDDRLFGNRSVTATTTNDDDISDQQINSSIKNTEQHNSENIIESSDSDVEMESLILSEDCSEPLEYDDKMSKILKSYENNDQQPEEVEQVLNNSTILSENIESKAQDDPENRIIDDNQQELTTIDRLKLFGEDIINSCKNLQNSTHPGEDERLLNDFIHEKLLEFKKFQISKVCNTISVQTDHSGKLYTEKQLKKFNQNEKLRLLEDSNSSDRNYSDDDGHDVISNGNTSRCSINSLHLRSRSAAINKETLNDNNLSSLKDIDLNDNNEEMNVASGENEVVVEAAVKDDEIVKENEPPDDEVENITVECDVNINSLDGDGDDSQQLQFEDKCNEPDKDDVNDKEINRLLDFKSLSNKKQHSSLQHQQGTNDPDKSPKTSKKNPDDNILDLLNGGKDDDSSDSSDSDLDSDLVSESDFLGDRNIVTKKQLLYDSSFGNSSGSDSTDTESVESEESNSSSTVGKFIEEQDDATNLSEIKDGNTTETNNPENKQKKSSNISINLEELPDNESGGEVVYSSKTDKNDNNKEKVDKTVITGITATEETGEIYEIDNNSTPEKTDTTTNIFDKSFEKRSSKNKSFETLLKEDVNRRENIKLNDELISLSSDDSDAEESAIVKESNNNRMLRPMMRQEQLASETKRAQKEEHGRILRLKKKETILKKAFKEHKKDRSNTKELILDYHTKSKSFIKVHPDLLKQLKQHQIDGVKFMYDACYCSVNFINEHPGSGCILAHCMGLGKTLQLITLLHTVISHKELNTSKILVLCPKSTVMNWADEIQRWLGPLNTPNLKIYTFSDTSDVKNKLSILKEWSNSGKTGSRNSGFLLIGYEAFRTLVTYHTYKKRSTSLTQYDIDAIQKTVKETLLNPGADLVVCDEGHIIKNRKAAISQAVTEIRTPRRIILTGTPIQNNLKEYYSMVNFIKPSFLGTEKEFANLYANPICNGQHKDSSKMDIKIMKQRSFVLHKKLSSFVQRREAALLKTFLPQKFEYVLFIPLSNVQTKLYEIFLVSVSKREDTKGRNLLTDYTCLRKIWTHPKVLENAWLNATMSKQRKENKRNANLIIQTDDEEPDDIYDSQTGLMSVTSDWWRAHLTELDLESILPSNKLQTMFEILKMCKENREKCLIFSAFVAVLNVVEFFMQLIHENDMNPSKKALGIEKYRGPWISGKDYYRLDGKTPKTLRHEMVKSFNDIHNERARVFLISAKAGGQGINLTGANRVLILDTSWNPSNDQQNIFRIFRLGQKRNCYIYRLLSLGTMEEKVYSRSVTKQAMSFRVVDEHQIDRHYSMAELAELYALTKADYSERPVPTLPQDSILANLLRNHSNLVYKYHEHDSLLENKVEQELSEQEKEDAWLAYERDTSEAAAATVIPPPFSGFDMFGNLGSQNYLSALEAYANNQNDTGFGTLGMNPNGPAPYLSNYGYPAPSSYLDMLAMYQNASNFSSSMFGIDPLPHSSLNPPNVPNNLLSNTSRLGSNPNLVPSTSNMYYGASSHGLPSNDLNSMHPSHYPSLYSQPSINPYSTPSSIELLKKKLESFANLGSTSTSLPQQQQQSRMHKQHPSMLPSMSNFSTSSYLSDLQTSSRNNSPTDAIPTSVIMKNNDLLLKKYSEQLQSLVLNPMHKSYSSNRSMYPTKQTAPGLSSLELSKPPDNNILSNHNSFNTNAQRADKLAANLSTPNFSITPITSMPDITNDKHIDLTRRNSPMSINNNNSSTGTKIVAKSPTLVSTDLTNLSDTILAQQNNNILPTNLSTLNYNTNSSITKNNYPSKTVSSATLINSTEPPSSPIKNSITISNTTTTTHNSPKNMSGNEKNNVVISKLQNDQDNLKKNPITDSNRPPKQHTTANLIETTTFRNTNNQLSNVNRLAEQQLDSDQTKYFNSGMSITPVMKKTVVTGSSGSNTSSSYNNNDSNQNDTQVNQRKRTPTTPVQPISPETDGTKRRKTNEIVPVKLTKLSNKSPESGQTVFKNNQTTKKVVTPPVSEIYELD